MSPDLVLSIIALVIYVLAPFVLALSARRWFWRVRYICKIRAKAQSFDAEKIANTANGLTIEQMRKKDGYGDKTVVTHLLRTWSEDLVDDVRWVFPVTTVVAATLVLLLCIIAVEASSTGGTSTAPANISFPDLIKSLTHRVLHAYLAPVGTYVGVLYYLTAVLVLRQQSRRYRDILER